MLQHISFRIKLIIFIFFTTFIPLVLILIFFFFQFENTVRNNILQERQFSAELTAKQLDQYFLERCNDVQSFAANPIFNSSEFPPATKLLFLQTLLTIYQDYNDLSIIETNGSVLFSVHYFYYGDWVNNQWFQKAISEKNVVVSDLLMIPGLDVPVISLFSPIYNAQHEVQAVLVAQLPVKKLQKIIASNQIGVSEEILIINEFDKIIAHADGSKIFDYFSYDIIENIDSTQGRIQTYVQNQLFLGVYKEFSLGIGTSTKPWKTIIIQKEEEFLKTIHAWRYNIFLVPSLFFLLILVGMLWGINSFTTVVKRLVKGAEEIALGNLNYRIPVVSQDDFGKLALAFNTMASKLQHFYHDLEKKIKEKTRQLSKSLGDVEKQKQALENTQRAILNLLEDVKVEEAVALQEKTKLQTLLDSIGDAVFAIDTNKKIFLFNRACERISGYRVQEALGVPYNSILTFISEKDRTTNALFIQEVLEKGHISQMGYNTLLVTKKGAEIPVADSAAPIVDQTGKVTGVIVVFHDMTKEREVETMKNEFISIASHQLRTPLTAIKWHIEMLKNNDAGTLPDKAYTYLDRTSLSLEKMSKLLNNLLNISRIEEGRIAINPEPMDIIQSTAEIIEEMRPLALEKKQQLTFISPDQKQKKYLIDSAVLHELLENIISNAIKYSPPTTGLVRVVLKISSQKITWLIQDNGYGIPESDFRHIFDRFYRASNIQKKDIMGSGLGLYVVKQLVDVSGGSIVLTSQENKGTRVTLTYPASGMKLKTGEKGIQRTA